MVGGDFKGGEVAHDAALAQAGLLVHHGLEQHGGVQLALHQEVGLTRPHQGHRLAGGLRQIGLVVDVLRGDVLAQLRQHLVDHRLVAHQDGGHDPLGPGAQDGLDGVGVARRRHGHAGAAGLALHVGDQLVKIVKYHAESLLTASGRGPAPGPSQRPAC